MNQVTRAQIVAEARSWIGTPYISSARVKGVGTDCAQFLVGTYVNAGVLAPFTIPHHPAQWHLHSGDERYLAELQKHSFEVSSPNVGDMAVFHIKKAYAHAGIVIEWPTIIHCLNRGGVQWGDASRDALLIMERRSFPVKFFSLWKPE